MAPNGCKFLQMALIWSKSLQIWSKQSFRPWLEPLGSCLFCLWVHWSIKTKFSMLVQFLMVWFAIKFFNGHYGRKQAKKQNIFKQAISDGPSTNQAQINSNVTKVYSIKWSQNYTRTIRSGVLGIAKFFLNNLVSMHFSIIWVCQQPV